jgi:hypothetical protein
MAKGPFQFLRATYWRWAETILEVCPDLANAPPVLAVGDTHLENFGSWRDADSRLVWGVRDFDDAAEMPYPLDLVRLVTSAMLAQGPTAIANSKICGAIIKGYGNGLNDPRPFVLEETHVWLRQLIILPDAARDLFWKKLETLKRSPVAPAERYRRAIAGAMPERGIDIKFRACGASGGALGRPRWIGLAEWRGGRVLREATALVTSGWTRSFGGGAQGVRCKELAYGNYRAPDPWYDAIDEVVVRRLSPNSRTVELGGQPNALLNPRMLHAMGFELANLSERKSSWLRQAAAAAAEFVIADHRQWMQAQARSPAPAGRRGH